jgi:16S rRNA (guanine1207-N2)-methyltransferase
MGHYFTNDELIKSEEKKVSTEINGIRLTFLTDYNVFSKKGLDFGTRTLLESLNVNELSGKVLDFGCGYGPIGIFLAKHKLDVDMIDVNLRALELSRKNADLNSVKAHIFASDLYDSVKEKYNYIITNPPIRVGKEILYKVLFEAENYLLDNGHLILVIHKDQGAKSTIRDLEKKYRVKILRKNKGFYVIDCEKR